MTTSQTSNADAQCAQTQSLSMEIGSLCNAALLVAASGHITASNIGAGAKERMLRE